MTKEQLDDLIRTNTIEHIITIDDLVDNKSNEKEVNEMEKLEVFAIDETTEFFQGEENTLVLCVKLTNKWCKPIRDIGGTFDKQIADPNSGIINALWRLDLNVDKKVDMMFDPNTQLDEFQQRRLKEFLTKRGE